MVKLIMHAIFVMVYLTVAFFGLGPVFFADGSNTERLWTFVIVVAILVSLIYVHRWLFRKMMNTNTAR